MAAFRQNVSHAYLVSKGVRTVIGFRVGDVLLFLACACLFTSALISQPLRFELISGEGLPNESIFCILKDHRGFMWFGTPEGIVRYDGYSFRSFKGKVASPGIASAHFIYAMIEDKAGYIWVGSVGNGLAMFDPVSKSFLHYWHDSTNEATISHNDIYALYQDQSGQLWIGTRAGLDRFDPTGNRFIHIHPSHHEGELHLSSQVTAIYETPDSPGALWVGTWGDGLFKYDVQRDSFVHIRNRSNSRRSLSNNFVRFIYQLPSIPHVLWVGTDGGGLNMFDVRRNAFDALVHDPSDRNSISSNGVRCMLQDRSGNVWVGTTGGGLNLFNSAQKTFRTFRNDPRNQHTICSNNVLCLFQDETGIEWVGTRSGLARFVPPQEQFILYQNSPNDKNSLSDNFLYSLFEDRKGILWIASDGGLNRFDAKTQSFASFRHQPGNRQTLANDYVRTIYEDREGRLWIGNTKGALHLFDRKTGHTRNISVRTDDFAFNEWAIRAIKETSDGTFWVGTTRGLFVVDRRSLTSRCVVLGPIGNDRSHPTKINCIYEDAEGTIWIGADPEGLVRYNPSSGVVKTYRHDAIVPGTLSHNAVTYVFEARDRTMWVTTAGGGLNKFDKSTERFVSYTTVNGLPHSVVYGALEDRSGNLWMSTNNGLCRFAPATGKIRNFGEHDGLQGMEYNSGSFVKSASGLMYFGGTNGLNAFYPDRMKDNDHIPPIVISTVEVFGAEIDPDSSVLESGGLVLPYDENSLSFEYAALDFRDPRQNRYAYKLEPLDKRWLESGSRRFSAYPHLTPGTYTFRVKGSNDNGVWNEAGTSLVVIITPPWWKTPWMYLGYALGILGLFYSFRRYEKNRVRLKHQAELEHLEAEKLREVDQLKSRFFTNISHEFRTPLTLIEGPVRQLQTGEFTGDVHEQYDLILRNTHQLLHLVNQLLDLAKIDGGKIRLHRRKLDLVDVVRGVAAAFEPQAKYKGIGFCAEYCEEPLIGWFDRDAVEKIFTNLLSNAFNFTLERGKVVTSVRRGGSSPYTVEITVADTGVGIPADKLDKIFDRFYQVDASQTREQEGTGIGLALTKELVELHKGKIAVTSELGKGSTFIVELPLSKEPFSPDEIAEGEETVSVQPTPALEPEATIAFEPEKEDLRGDETLPLLLLIEDNADMRKYMRTHLEHNYRISEAVNGEEGVHKAIETVPDVVISDVMMPKMDGFEVCRLLKKDEKTSHIPVILLTAKAGTEHKLEGLETGADDYITKPFDARELLVRVKNLIEVRKQLRGRFLKGEVLGLKEIAVTSADERFLNRALEVVETHLSDSSFNTEVFATEMFLGRMQLHRKIKGLTGHSPWEFVRLIRLERAAQLLRKHAGSVADIGFQIGFDEPTHFTEAFHRRYGVPPTEYEHRHSGLDH